MYGTNNVFIVLYFIRIHTIHLSEDSTFIVANVVDYTMICY